MSERRKIYLAGPEVFLADAIDVGRRKKELCAEYGFEGLFPFDNEAPPAEPRRDLSIYRANVDMLRGADGGIFNLTPFRGPHADVGTVFELGLLAGFGKPAFGYSYEGEALLDRMKRDGQAAFDEASQLWLDGSGMAIEDFGRADNLMIDACLAEQGHPLVRRRASAANRFTGSRWILALPRTCEAAFCDRPARARRRLRAVGIGPQASAFQAAFCPRSASTPGRSLPSSHSRKAPPAVET
jgi:nucleoside 2-deoxyribosyltransferase